MDLAEIVKQFTSTTCWVCGRAKRDADSFCVVCYRALPPLMQKALWRRFGSGYEEAHSLAFKRLRKAQADFLSPNTPGAL